MFTDVFVGLNFAVALFVLTISMFMKPERFKFFPNVLIISRVFRLLLNFWLISRLLNFQDTGKIIKVLGDSISSGDASVGLIIFIILTICSFLIVITSAKRCSKIAEKNDILLLKSINGATRFVIAEVIIMLISFAVVFIAGVFLFPEYEIYGFINSTIEIAPAVTGYGLCLMILMLIGSFGTGMVTTIMATGKKQIYTTIE
jgi:flagellar biosynthesis component FlhA